MKHIYIFALISLCLLGCDDDTDISPVETLPEVEYQLYSEFLDFVFIDTLVVQKESNGDLASVFIEQSIENAPGQVQPGTIDPTVLQEILVVNQDVIVYEDKSEKNYLPIKDVKIIKETLAKYIVNKTNLTITKNSLFWNRSESRVQYKHKKT